MMIRIISLLLCLVTLLSCSADMRQNEVNTSFQTSHMKPLETCKPMEPLEKLDFNPLPVDPLPIESPSEPLSPIPYPFVEFDDIILSGKEIHTYGEKISDDKIAEIEKIVQSYPKAISFAFYSIDGMKALTYNTSQTYFSACTIKIPWMLYLCKEIDKGTYNKDTVLTYQARHWMAGSGKIRYNAYGSTYSIEELITLCLSISDNVAYVMLVEYMGRDGYNKFIDELGFKSLSTKWSGNGLWSGNSVVMDYIKIWNEVNEYFKTDTVGAKILKNACTNTPFAYGTDALDDEYSHKSGDNWNPNPAHNDAGIVWTERPYLYAIFTKSEGDNYDEKIINQIVVIANEIFTS